MRIWPHACVLISVALTIFPAQIATASPECYDYESVNAVVDHAWLDLDIIDFIVDRDLAFVIGNYLSFHVVDISDFDNPVILTSLELGMNVCNLHRDGNRLYVRAFDGIWIIDIGNPLEPVILGYMSLLHVVDLVANGDYLYVANGPQTFRVISVANPAQPVIVAERAIEGNAIRVLLHADHVILLENYTALHVYDVSAPGNPILVKTCPVDWTSYQAVMLGDLAIFAARDHGLWIIDVSDPGDPQKVATWSGADCYKLATTGERCFVIDPDGGLFILDISNLPMIKKMTSMPYLNRGRSVDVRDGQVMMTVGDRDLILVDPDVSQGSPGPIWSVLYEETTYGHLEASGQHLYGTYVDLPNSDYGLQVFEIDPLGAVTKSTRLEFESSPLELEISDELVYLAAREAGVVIVDVEFPNAPTVIGAIDLPYKTCDVAARQDIAYAGVKSISQGQVIALDVHDPMEPTVLWSLPLDSRVYAIEATDGVVVASTDDRELHTIAGYDRTDPSTAEPQWLGSVELPMSAFDLKADSNLVYAMTRRAVHVVDVSVPKNPQIVGTWTPIDHDTHMLTQLDLVGDLLYVGTWYHGVMIVNVSDPTTPCLIGFIQANDHVKGIAVQEDALFLGNWNSGLQGWPLQCLEQPVQKTVDRAVAGIKMRLLTAYPSPANPAVNIPFVLDCAQFVRLSVFDIGGRLVEVIVNERRGVGPHHVTWIGRDSRGREVPSGTYVVRLETEYGAVAKKVALVR